MDWAAALISGGVSGATVGSVCWYLLKRANERADAAMSMAQAAQSDSQRALAELQRLQLQGLVSMALCDAKRQACAPQIPLVLAKLESMDAKLDEMRERVARLEVRRENHA